MLRGGIDVNSIAASNNTEIDQVLLMRILHHTCKIPAMILRMLNQQRLPLWIKMGLKGKKKRQVEVRLSSAPQILWTGRAINCIKLFTCYLENKRKGHCNHSVLGTNSAV